MHLTAPQLAAGRLVRGQAEQPVHIAVPHHLVARQIPFIDADFARLVCQRNALHQMAVHLLALFQLRDIDNLRNKVERLLRAVAHQRYRQARPDDLAAFAEVAFLDGIGVNLAAQQPVGMLQIVFQIVGMGNLLEGELFQLGVGEAERQAERVIDLQPASLRRHQRHADGGIFHRVAKPGFAFADVVLFAPESVHHQRHHVARDQRQQKGQPAGDLTRHLAARLDRREAERQDQRYRAGVQQKQQKRVALRQPHRTPEEDHHDKGERPGHKAQRQPACARRQQQGEEEFRQTAQAHRGGTQRPGQQQQHRTERQHADDFRNHPGREKRKAAVAADIQHPQRQQAAQQRSKHADREHEA